MAQALVFARTHITPIRLIDAARALIVSGCCLALVLAGPALPF